jgi:hypothetical protein
MDTTTLVFYIALFVHLVCLIMGFGAVMVIDTCGLLWILKKTKLEFVNRVADVTQRLIWTGWFGLVLSGTVLLTIKGFIDNLTAVKLFFVAMLGVNGIFLHLMKKNLEGLKVGQKMPALVKFRMGITSTISQLGWWGAIVIGFLHRHIEEYIPWPPNPWLVMAAIVGIFFIVWLIGERLLNKNESA